MNRWIEDEVRRNPQQYLWVHKRFKTRPEGAPPVY
jgi:KDO2-lipid IV(A) lauroyltransferase